jgi:DNA end-binding protein Ku
VEHRSSPTRTEILNQKQVGRPIAKLDRPKASNVVDLMEALRQSIKGSKKAAPAAKPARAKKQAKTRKAS